MNVRKAPQGMKRQNVRHDRHHDSTATTCVETGLCSKPVRQMPQIPRTETGSIFE